MKTAHQYKLKWFPAALACIFSLPAQGALIVNGGFEAGFAGWTRLDQLGSEGTFFLQAGTSSPVNAFTVPAPPGGTTAAMTDAAGPGSHVLYQDFVVTGGLANYSFDFSLFVRNAAGAFSTTANSLDFSTPTLNQRARVDIIRTAADPFSLAAGDVLQNLFETQSGPLVTGYNNFSVNVSALLQANQGNTLRVRFAEVDNVDSFNFGVDNVNVQITSVAVPDTLPWMVQWLTLGVVAVWGARFRRRQQPGLAIQ